MRKVRIGVLKIGCTGCTPLLEYLFDERAERVDIEIRVFGCGAKMLEDEVKEVCELVIKSNPDLVIVVTPNASLPAPLKALNTISSTGAPTLVISDAPAKKAVNKFEAMNIGYLLVLADSMIGARREFLDPVEMAIYNSDIIKVLAITGAYNIIYEQVSKLVDALKKGEKPVLPQIIVDSETAVNAAEFNNPYARAKAIAAYEIAKTVSKLTTVACFKIKERERYISYAAAAHEMMRYAAHLAEEAREIEKYGDHVVRKPHSKEGEVLRKLKLLEKTKGGQLNEPLKT